MGEILYISKPVAPPWNDSSKNLVRDIASGLLRHRARVMGRRAAGAAPEGLEAASFERLYAPSAGGFAPALSDNLRVLTHLLLGSRADLWHFFFAPNPRSSSAGRLASRLRGKPSVHTVCSAPAEGVAIDSILFATCTVVLSRHTEARLLASGVEPARLRRISPAIPPLEAPSPEARREARRALGLPENAPIVLYPGDLEFGRGAPLTMEAFAADAPAEALLVMACRAKTPAAREREAELRARAAALGIASRMRWIGETPRIHALLGAADLVLLPSETLYAKMDHPLVLLEAMCLERACVVATGTPAAELGEGGGAEAVEAVPEAVGAALRRLLGDDVARAELGRRGRARVLDEHDPARMVRSYETLYDELLG